jgi:hypothetical protein
LEDYTKMVNDLDYCLGDPETLRGLSIERYEELHAKLIQYEAIGKALRHQRDLFTVWEESGSGPEKLEEILLQQVPKFLAQHSTF